MQYLKLNPEVREASDEPTLKLMEEYDAAFGKEMLKLSEKYDVAEVQEALDAYNPMFIGKVSGKLKRYRDMGGENALPELKTLQLIRGVHPLPELTQDLRLIMAELVSQCSQFIENKRREEELRKAAKAEEERRKREEEKSIRQEQAQAEQKRTEAEAEAKRKEQEADERWRAACRAVNPPDKDAKRYLDRPGEYDEFEKATLEAIEVYLKKGEDYLDDSRAFDYQRCLRKIKDKKEEEQIRNAAEAQAQAFHARLDQGLKQIERMLSPKREDPTVIFQRRCSDKGETRYLEEPFTDISDKNSNWTEGYITPAEDNLRQLIPKELWDFILMKPNTAFFLLPSALYGHYGVPCLDIYFDVFAVVTIKVLAKAGKKVFNGYAFDFLTNLREPKCLGFYQIIINPNHPNFWQSVPLIILYALMDGNLQPPGTTILQRTDQLTVYEVNKFEDNICEIPKSLERCFRSLGSMEKLKEAQVIDGRTAEILKLPGPVEHKGTKKQPSKQSKKDQAEALFKEGEFPSSPRVKKLGIKYKTCQVYYNTWKREHKS
ncbi:hypothetical protein ACFLVW_02655 [Chloroflexota bacterium]